LHDLRVHQLLCSMHCSAFMWHFPTASQPLPSTQKPCGCSHQRRHLECLALSSSTLVVLTLLQLGPYPLSCLLVQTNVLFQFIGVCGTQVRLEQSGSASSTPRLTPWAVLLHSCKTCLTPNPVEDKEGGYESAAANLKVLWLFACTRICKIAHAQESITCFSS